MRALEAGVRAANTFRRLDQVVALGAMNENDASSLRDALILINRVRLDHQAVQMGAGRPPTNFVPAEELSPLMRRNLKAAFMLVVEAQTGLTSRYQLG
jgi:CBS domain-containing protein